MSLRPKVVPLPPFSDADADALREPLRVTVHRMIGAKASPVALPAIPGQETGGVGYTCQDIRDLNHALYWIFGEGQYHCTALDEDSQQYQWQAFVSPVEPPADSGGRIARHARYGRHGVAPQPSQPVIPLHQQLSGPGTVYGGGVFGQPGYSAGVPQPKSTDPEVYELKSQLERERLDSKHRDQFNALGQEMRRMQEAGVNRAPDAASETIRALERRLEDSERRSEEERRRSETEAVRRQQEDQLRQIQENTNRQIEALTKLVEQSASRKDEPNQMMLFMQMMNQQTQSQQTMAQLQADAQKEVARLAAETAREQARTAIGPQQLIEIMLKANQGAEQVTSQFSRILDIQHSAFESVMQLQGTSNPLVDMGQQILQQVGGAIENFTTMKQHQAQLQAQSQERMAQMSLAAQRGNHQQVAQLEGAQAQAHAEHAQVSEQITETESELFGPAWPSVQKLRQGVALKMVTPEKATEALLAGMANLKDEIVPAFSLWAQGEYLQLVELLVPDADDGFKDRFTQAIVVHQTARRPNVNGVGKASPPEIEVEEEEQEVSG